MESTATQTSTESLPTGSDPSRVAQSLVRLRKLEDVAKRRDIKIQSFNKRRDRLEKGLSHEFKIDWSSMGKAARNKTLNRLLKEWEPENERQLKVLRCWSQTVTQLAAMERRQTVLHQRLSTVTKAILKLVEGVRLSAEDTDAVRQELADGSEVASEGSLQEEPIGPLLRSISEKTDWDASKPLGPQKQNPIVRTAVQKKLRRDYENADMNRQYARHELDQYLATKKLYTLPGESRKRYGQRMFAHLIKLRADVRKADSDFSEQARLAGEYSAVSSDRMSGHFPQHSVGHWDAAIAKEEDYQYNKTDMEWVREWREQCEGMVQEPADVAISERTLDSRLGDVDCGESSCRLTSHHRIQKCLTSWNVESERRFRELLENWPDEDIERPPPAGGDRQGSMESEKSFVTTAELLSNVGAAMPETQPSDNEGTRVAVQVSQIDKMQTRSRDEASKAGESASSNAGHGHYIVREASDIGTAMPSPPKAPTAWQSLQPEKCEVS